MEVKVDKNWLAKSTSLHESLTLLSANKKLNSCDSQVHFLLSSQIDAEDILKLSEFTSQCTVLDHDIDSSKNVIKIFLKPNGDFNYKREYVTP